MRRWLPFLPLLVLALLGALFAGYALNRDPEVKPDALVGQHVPTIALSSLEGGDPRPIGAGGGPYLVNLFASWCAPCRIEHPELVRLRSEGAHIVGVAYRDDPIKTRLFLEQLGNPYETVVVDRAGDAGIEFGVSGVPETFLVDGQGVIVAKHSGPMTRQDADRLLARLQALR